MKKFILLFIFFVALTGCESDFDFDRPGVVSVFPSHNSILSQKETTVIVDFSKTMDTVKTNNEFSLSSDSGRINGFFAWENGDKRLVFTPGKLLTGTGKYTIRITAAAEDTGGNDLKDEFVSDFFVNSDSGSPYVIAFTPSADSIGNTPGTPVTITFSEPVDLNSIYSGITISPSIQGRFRWNAGSADSAIITFEPLYGFEYGVTYNVKVGDTIHDVTGNKLREPFTFNFTVGDDFVKPGVAVFQDLPVHLNFDESFVTSGAEKDKRLVLKFSETVRSDNFRSSVTISPSAGFYISSEVLAGATVAYINFTENLESGETYTLRISSGITDLQGNPLLKDYRFVFITDGINSISPVVLEIGDLVPPALPALQRWIKGDIQQLLLQADPLIYNDIVIDFNHQIDPLSLSIYVETVLGTGISPSVINIDWPDTPPAPSVKFMRLKFGIYNIYSGSTYRIVINGGKNGLRGMNGNYMKEDFVQMVSF